MMTKANADEFRFTEGAHNSLKHRQPKRNVVKVMVGGRVVWSAQRPRVFDVFVGSIYWIPWSGDRLQRTERLGQGNTTTILRGQTSAQALRLLHNLRYGADIPSTR